MNGLRRSESIPPGLAAPPGVMPGVVGSLAGWRQRQCMHDAQMPERLQQRRQPRGSHGLTHELAFGGHQVAAFIRRQLMRKMPQPGERLHRAGRRLRIRGLAQDQGAIECRRQRQRIMGAADGVKATGPGRAIRRRCGRLQCLGMALETLQQRVIRTASQLRFMQVVSDPAHRPGTGIRAVAERGPVAECQRVQPGGGLGVEADELAGIEHAPERAWQPGFEHPGQPQRQGAPPGMAQHQRRVQHAAQLDPVDGDAKIAGAHGSIIEGVENIRPCQRQRRRTRAAQIEHRRLGAGGIDDLAQDGARARVDTQEDASPIPAVGEMVLDMGIHAGTGGVDLDVGRASPLRVDELDVGPAQQRAGLAVHTASVLQVDVGAREPALDLPCNGFDRAGMRAADDRRIDAFVEAIPIVSAFHGIVLRLPAARPARSSGRASRPGSHDPPASSGRPPPRLPHGRPSASRCSGTGWGRPRS
mmetsp:Transcript_15036/g.35533  ORF Transcript_15036/g.35533 Transcript_15036/m.35533 type:complete len:473 (-) Transcript_15036:977-2395(-)